MKSKIHLNDQVTREETSDLLHYAEQCLSINGDFVELGCYRGDTSILLGQLIRSTTKKLFAYDSFAGLPEKTPEDHSGAGANFQAGELLVSKREVLDKIHKAGLHNIILKKAWFDQLGEQDLPTRIAFAFCDGDLYSSIRVSLQLVLPRLAQRGIIIVHDYNNPKLPGSARAVDEFLCQHPEFHCEVRHTLAILRPKC